MTPDTFELLKAIGAILGTLLFTGLGGFGVHRWRNGRPTDQRLDQQPQPRAPLPSAPQLQGYPMAPPPAGLVDTAADTGRHDPPWMTDTQRNMPTPFGLTAGQMQQLARDLQKAAAHAPATAQDVANAVDPVRQSFSDFREHVSASMLSIRGDIQSLPCKSGDNGDGNCDLIEVPVTMPPRHPANLRRVKP